MVNQSVIAVLLTLSYAEECVGDTFLPAFPGETDFNPVLRGIFYFIGMVWMFLGIAIAADKFMEAISVITAKTKKIYIAGEEVDVLVWNETVANLTLMALGSSAPEILLALIESISLGFEAGDLGPGTIVGSAAFNLLVITAICVVFIPHKDPLKPEEEEELIKNGEEYEKGERYIKELGVFAITATFSIFAYVWMLIVLSVSSPDEIEMWEAWVTLLFFPILVLIAYLQDKKAFSKCTGKDEKSGYEEDQPISHIVGAHKEHDTHHAESPEDVVLQQVKHNGDITTRDL